MLKLAKLLWASPGSLVGLIVGVVLLLLGGKAKCMQGTLEVAFRKRHMHCGNLMRGLPFRAITFGHVILAITEEELDHLRAHERVHVRQYERWGIFFFPAYLASSLWQLLRGRRAYWDNYFEVQARRESSRRG
ncbi:MAG TPA: signal peptide prediction [Methylophilaceae bacterium]|nr:signal peptide prediction [Methylophilaceae bacterium]